MTGTAYLEYDYLPDFFGLEMEDTETLHGLLLDVEQQLALTKLIGVGDINANQRMIAHNLRLVFNIAKRYTNHSVVLLDLVREGILGFIHALEKFELEGGFRFSTYARWCIRENIEHAIRNQNNYLPMTTCKVKPS